MAPERATVGGLRIVAMTAVAMIAFAGNSLLCRIALKQTGIDAVSFTTIRIVAALLALLIIIGARRGVKTIGGDWPGAIVLCAYAFAFSFAYVALPAATGALLLIGGTQLAMIGYGFWSGERLYGRQWVGLLLALGGLIGLLLPGASAPPVMGALLMLFAGIAWGIYCLLGKGGRDPIEANAGNFVRALPVVLMASLATYADASIDAMGFGYAVASGALTTALGYVIWYTALRGMRAVSAAVIQLSVPLITAMGGALFLAEPVTLQLALAALATLGGIALVIRRYPTRGSPI